MIFKRKKSDDLSSTSIKDVIDEKITSKVKIFYVAAMCFAAACLSFMALEVGSRNPLGHSITKPVAFNTIFRRTYNLKIKILITNIVMGLITTIILAIGDIYSIPYLYIPWLINTMKGMIFCEGPALLTLSYIWLPDAGVPTGTFIFFTLLLFVEELCLWFDVFSSFKNCWIDYIDRMSQSIINGVEEPSAVGKRVYACREQNVEQMFAKSKLRDENAGLVIESTDVSMTLAKSTSSNNGITLRPTRSFNDKKIPKFVD